MRPMNEFADRFCIRCGRAEPEVQFRSDQAAKCLNCDALAAEERKAYYRDYHKARHAAVARLVEAHQKEFDRYLMEERESLDLV